MKNPTHPSISQDDNKVAPTHPSKHNIVTKQMYAIMNKISPKDWVKEVVRIEASENILLQKNANDKVISVKNVNQSITDDFAAKIKEARKLADERSKLKDQAKNLNHGAWIKSYYDWSNTNSPNFIDWVNNKLSNTSKSLNEGLYLNIEICNIDKDFLEDLYKQFYNAAYMGYINNTTDGYFQTNQLLSDKLANVNNAFDKLSNSKKEEAMSDNESRKAVRSEGGFGKGPKPSFTSLLKKDAEKSAYRTGATQGIKALKVGLSKALAHESMNQDQVSAVMKFFDTDFGEMMLRAGLGYGLTMLPIPGIQDNKYAQNVSEELRVSGLSKGMDRGMELMNQFIVPSLMEVFQENPMIKKVMGEKEQHRVPEEEASVAEDLDLSELDQPTYSLGAQVR